MCYTNPFTGPETWAGFEVSHSYPFCLILLCQRSQVAPRRMWSGRGELSFHRLRDWARRWLSWPFCVPGRSGSGPGLSGRFRCFVWAGSVSTSPAASHDGIPPVWPWPPLSDCYSWPYVNYWLMYMRIYITKIGSSVNKHSCFHYLHTSSDECLFQPFQIYSRLIFHQISCHLYIIIFKMPLICMINCLRNVSTVHPCSKRGNLNDFIVRSYLINQSSRCSGYRPAPAAIHHQKSRLSICAKYKKSKGEEFSKQWNTIPNCSNPKSCSDITETRIGWSSEPLRLELWPSLPHVLEFLQMEGIVGKMELLVYSGAIQYLR